MKKNNKKKQQNKKKLGILKIFLVPLVFTILIFLLFYLGGKRPDKVVKKQFSKQVAQYKKSEKELENKYRVISVSDGDTITVLKNKKTIKIRLYGVDAPERYQPYGAKAKRYISSMVYNKNVDIKVMDKDRYGRTVALIYFDNGKKILNEELINNGYAWAYVYYLTEPYKEKWIRLEKNARVNKRGLWKSKKPLPPWEFRKISRGRK
ncbi:thermonuclease family protein [bacterium]